MRLAIMQPYFFPYIGYFQLIKECDVFVWLDDAQYTKRGWINRNRILLRGDAHDFVFSVNKGAQALAINDRWYSASFQVEANALLKTLQMAYRKAPMYEPVRDLVTRLLSSEDRNVATFNCSTLEALCAHLDIAPVFVRSSQLSGVSGLRGEERIIGIAKMLGGGRYVNPIGGTSLYSSERFARAGLTLNFMESGEIKYKQLGDTFVPRLSIIDVLMFADPAVERELLEDYSVL